MAKTLVDLHIPLRQHSMFEKSVSSSLSLDLKSLVVTCGDLREGVESSLEQLDSRAYRELRLIRKQQRSARKKKGGAWRKQPEYNTRRDDIKLTLRTQGINDSHRELNVLKQVLGLPGVRSKMSLQDLSSDRMKALLNLNQRSFGEKTNPTEIQLPDPPRVRKARLKRLFNSPGIDRKQMYSSSLPLQGVKQFDLYQRLMATYVDPVPVSPLNQFIFKHAQKYKKKGLWD